MGKMRDAAPVEVDDFEPFYRKAGKLWVPYYAGGKLRLHTLDYRTAWKGVGYALRVLSASGEIVPFAMKAMQAREKAKEHG